MPRSYPSYRPDRRRDQKADPKSTQYEFFKEAWRANHPEATPEEYEKAMQDIARRIGL